MDSQIAKKNQSLTTAEEMRNQTKLVMQPYANWEEYLTPAPLSIAILGELVFISSKTDFSINKNPPKDGYKYIRYPDSFRACLMQVCNSGWWAFNEAHKNMDQIRLHTMTVPDYMKTAVKILFQGSDEVVEAHLPDQLENIRVIADDCLELANATEKRFTDVINIIQELLEACVNAQCFYGDELENIKRKLEETKMRKKSSEEASKRSEKVMKAMEEQLMEVHKNYNKAMDSPPSGWEMRGMDLVAGLTEGVTTLVNGLTAVISQPVNRLCQASTTLSSTIQNITGQESAADDVDEIIIYSKSAEILMCTENVQKFVQDHMINWKDLHDQKSKATSTDFQVDQLKKIKESLEESPKCKAKIDAQNICDEGIAVCAKLAKYAPEGDCDKNKENKLVNRIRKLTESARIFDCKSKDVTKSPALTPKPPLMYEEESKSEKMSASENSRFHIEQSCAQLDKTRKVYERNVESIEKNRKELTEILNEMRNYEVMEEQLKDAHESYNKAMDSLPSGWEEMYLVAGLTESITNFANGVTTMITQSRSQLCNASTAISNAIYYIKDPESAVGGVDVINIYSKSTEILTWTENVQKFVKDNMINWKDLYDQKRKATKTDFQADQFKIIKESLERNTNCKPKEDAQNICDDICDEGIVMCKELANNGPDVDHKKAKTKVPIEMNRKHSESAHIFNCKNKDIKKCPDLTPKPPIMYKEESNSEKMSASQSVSENVRFCIEQSSAQLDKNRELYERSIENMEKNQKELTEILIGMRNCEVMEEQLKKAHESYNKAMDSLPSGWEVMDLVASLTDCTTTFANGVITMITQSGNQLDNASTTISNIIQNIKGQQSAVDDVDVTNIYSKSAEILMCTENVQKFVQDNMINWKDLHDQKSKATSTDFQVGQLKKIMESLDESPKCKAKIDAQNICDEGIAVCAKLAKYAPEGDCDKNKENKLVNRIRKLTESARIFDKKSKLITKSPALTPKPPMMYKEESKSERVSASQGISENSRFCIEQSCAQLDNTREIYEKSVENIEKNHKELIEILIEMRNYEVKEEQLKEAHESYKKALDSLPSGKEVMDLVAGLTEGITIFINEVTAMITLPVNQLSNASTTISNAIRSFKGQESGVDAFDVNNIYSKSAEILTCTENVQKFVQDNTINWKDLYDQKKKATKTDFQADQFKRIKESLEGSPNCKAKEDAQNICDEGIAVCKELTKYAPEGDCDKNTKSKLVKRIRKLTESARKFDSKSKDFTVFPVLTPKPSMMYEEESKSEKISASQRASENTRFHIEQSRAQLDKSREMYEKTVDNMEKNQKELAEIMITIRNCEVMEEQLKEAHESYKEAMDSLPSRKKVMDLSAGLTEVITTFVNEVTAMVTQPVNQLCNASTTISNMIHCIKGQESSVDGVDLICIYSKSSEILTCTENVQNFVRGNTINWKDLYDQKRKTTVTDFQADQFKRIMKSLEGSPNCKPKEDAQNICDEGIAVCAKLAKYTPELQCDKNKEDKLVNRIRNLIESARIFNSKSKLVTKSSTLTSHTEESKSEKVRTSQRASENARFRIEQSRSQLDKTREIYEKSVENMEKNQKELTEILITMRNCDIKEIDFNTTIQMLVKGMDAMGRVKEQWEKMVRFFQMVSNIVKTSLTRTLKDFVSTSEKTQKLSYNSKLLSKDLLYNQAFQATNIASLVNMISATYTEVSTNHLMDRVSSLGKLMAMDKDKPEFLSEHLQLQKSCDEAQRAILQLVLKNKEEFERKSLARLEKIDKELLAILPAAAPEEIKSIQAAVKSGFAEEEEAGYY